MNFQLSQLILIAAICLFLLYVFRVKSVLIERLVYLALVSVGIVFVLYPGLSTRVANLVGIGRGADLILYIFVIFTLFHHVNNASRLRAMERQMTTLARRAAINGAVANTVAPDSAVAREETLYRREANGRQDEVIGGV